MHELTEKLWAKGVCLSKQNDDSIIRKWLEEKSKKLGFYVSDRMLLDVFGPFQETVEEPANTENCKHEWRLVSVDASIKEKTFAMYMCDKCNDYDSKSIPSPEPLNKESKKQEKEFIYVITADQVQCGHCGFLQHFDKKTGRVEFPGHAPSCCGIH